MANILLVEDSTDIRDVVLAVLQTDHEVTWTPSLQSAKAWIEAGEEHYDLILMDIQLPEISGLEVTKWLKEDDELSSIPVIAVTAFAMKGDEERIRQGGCEAYLSKPISVAKFIATVKTYLDVEAR